MKQASWKESRINGQREALIRGYYSGDVGLGDDALHDLSPLTAVLRPTVLRRDFTPVLTMRDNQLDGVLDQRLTQRVAIIAADMGAKGQICRNGTVCPPRGIGLCNGPPL